MPVLDDENAPDNGSTVRTLCPLPEGAMPLEAVEVCGYLDADGSRCWVVRYSGDMPLSSSLGLLRLAEHQMIKDFYDEPSDA